MEWGLEEGRRVGLFLNREDMIRYLLDRYDQLKAGNVIWAQCVRCTDFTHEVRTRILEAARRGVRFQMVITEHSPAAEEFRALFDPIDGAEVIEAPDNAISMQGLSDREVVIAFPGMESYTAVLVRDPYFVQIVRMWCEARSGKYCQHGPSS